MLERGIAGGQRARRTTSPTLIAERRKHLGDDILSDLIRAEEAGDRLEPSELISQSIGLLIAGFETTIGLIGNGVLALIRHPDQLRAAAARPELIESAVEECLRYDGPIALTIRVTREDTRFGDKVIPRDRPVMCMLFGANRDPAHFPDPDRFDITRAGQRPSRLRRRRPLLPRRAPGAHGGAGRHRRPGASASPTLELQRDELVWGRSLFRVLGELPIRCRS